MCTPLWNPKYAPSSFHFHLIIILISLILISSASHPRHLHIAENHRQFTLWWTSYNAGKVGGHRTGIISLKYHLVCAWFILPQFIRYYNRLGNENHWRVECIDIIQDLADPLHSKSIADEMIFDEYLMFLLWHRVYCVANQTEIWQNVTPQASV